VSSAEILASLGQNRFQVSTHTHCLCAPVGSFEQFSLLPFATNEIRFFGPPRRMRHVFALHLFLVEDEF